MKKNEEDDGDRRDRLGFRRRIGQKRRKNGERRGSIEKGVRRVSRGIVDESRDRGAPRSMVAGLAPLQLPVGVLGDGQSRRDGFVDVKKFRRRGVDDGVAALVRGAVSPLDGGRPALFGRREIRKRQTLGCRRGPSGAKIGNVGGARGGEVALRREQTRTRRREARRVSIVGVEQTRPRRGARRGAGALHPDSESVRVRRERGGPFGGASRRGVESGAARLGVEVLMGAHFKYGRDETSETRIHVCLARIRSGDLGCGARGR